MNNYLKEEATSLVVQNEQLKKSNSKISEIESILENIEKEQNSNDILLDNLNKDMEKLFSVYNISKDFEPTKIELALLDIELENLYPTEDENIKFVEKIENINFSEDMNWEEYFNSIKEYAFFNSINLSEDPFRNIMSKTQQLELQKRIKEEFTLKNANCDKYDYMIAGTCGLISGLIDILFVGSPANSKLGTLVDSQANKITENFAEFLGWDKEKAISRGSDTTKSAIGWLENKFKINYDQATTNGKNGTGGMVEDLSASNHHLKSLGHSPDIIGLFFSILNQFTNTSSFISNGQIITINTETFELQGGNFIAKIFCGFSNWFGHIMSDWTGSSGAKGRGSGVPIPFYNLLQMINVGSFGQHKETFSTITTKVFQKGYDFRHGITMAIPVVINELLIRFMYTMKARFYYNKEWEESIPKESIPELRRMLLVGHGTLCLVDGADAYVRSGGGANIVELLSRTNLIAWIRFGHLAYKELYAWYNEGDINIEALNEYLEKDLRIMLQQKE